MTNTVNIICMKWGDKFPASYVNRLYGMISRNITLPFQLVCFTEISDGIREEVLIKPLPKLDLPEGFTTAPEYKITPKKKKKKKWRNIKKNQSISPK